jgi:vancomycin resistance protein YoaR
LGESQGHTFNPGEDKVDVNDISTISLNSTHGGRTTKNRILNKRRKTLLFISSIILVILLCLGIPLSYYTWDHHTIVTGVKINGINISNMTQADAKSVVDENIKHITDQSIHLIDGQHIQDVTLENLGLSVSADQALENAYAISRKGSLYRKVVSKMEAAKGVNLELETKWDDKKMTATLNQLLASNNKPAVDASFNITPQNTMNIMTEQAGSSFDLESLKTQIKAVDIYHPTSDFKVDFKEQPPQVTAAMLESQKITGLLASYTTRFDPSQTARTENVQLAAKSLDMAVIKPGDTLSFNKIVGERTVEGGYKDAYIILDGKFVPGLAGGICQVSSTLYNTGLMANLSVVQRSNHDLAITYVPLGQDATVAYPDLDLKFENNTGGYLLVRTKTTSDSLTIDLYGKVNPGQEVSISNTTESVVQPEEQRIVDATLKHGQTLVKQQGQPGYIVKSIRTVKVNGKVISSQPLIQSIYKALPKIIAIGP